MKTTIYALSALLVAQVALAVGLNVSATGLGGQPASTPLLAFAAGDVNRLSIADGDGNSVVLARAGEKWTLPDQGDFPADTDKVKTLLDDLTKAEESAPVATSSGAPERFRVAADDFERKLVFGPADKPLATVYMGSAQGTRQVHVRRDDQDGVRRIGFGIYQAPAKPDDWLDRAVLQVKADKITAIAWGDVRIERRPAATDAGTGDAAAATTGTDATTAATASAAAPAPAPGWQLAGDPAKPLDAAPVAALTDKLARLWLVGLAPEAPAADAGQAPKLDLTITLDDGTTREYRILNALADGDYAVATASLPRPVKLSKSAAEDLIKATEDKAFAPAGADHATGEPTLGPTAHGG